MPQNKRFADMKTNIGNEVGDTSSSFATRLGVYINNRYMDIIKRLTNTNLFEIYRSVTATTTSGTRFYPMPFDYGKIIYATDQSNNRSLDVITEKEWVDRFASNLTQKSTPIAIIEVADSTIRVQPTASTLLKLVSSSSSDTSQSVFVRGISGSAEYYETVNLSGTTSAGTSNSYDYVLQLGKSALTTGAVTITYVTGGGSASIITPQATEQRFKRIGFHYMPAGTYDIDIRYEREIQPLVNDNDYPIIDIAAGMEIGAKADAWRTKRFFEFAGDFENRYELWLDKYMAERMMEQMHQFQPTPYDRNAGY